MPSVEENRTIWNEEYAWKDDGEEWSAPWGNSKMQWERSIMPRIRPYLPASTMLEIGPGHGRWTKFLRRHCEELILVDLSPACIAYCKKRFERHRNRRFHVNDGQSLTDIPDASIDFVFSFDSLVHAEAEICSGYFEALAKSLRPQGTCFLHHSNLGQYQDKLPWFEMPKIEHWRSRTMTAAHLREYCERSGLHCYKQKLVSWGSSGWLIDAFSHIRLRTASAFDPRTEMVENHTFMRDAAV